MDLSQYVIPTSTDFCVLECKQAFDCLTPKEKKYAHYLSRASWYGGLIVLFQTSPESPGIYLILTKLFRHESSDELKAAADKAGVSDEDFQAFMVYCAALFSNTGNYKSFGDSKIIPGISKEKLEAVIKCSQAYKKDAESIDELWKTVRERMYSLTEKNKQLGLGDKGVTTYFSANCTLEDAEVAKQFLTAKEIPAWNTRCFKGSDGVIEIRLASAETTPASKALLYLGESDFEADDKKVHKFNVTRGDYSGLMALCYENLEEAKKYAANSTEESMLEKYIISFTNGSCQDHKDGSRYWIKDKGPVVESYIGFIENYRDPVGLRSEFEGFVAMVNKEMSAKFTNLVEKAETYLPRLPWGTDFEKDKFLQPDFTSLDVLAFAGSGIPAGINIPNYDEIRQAEGFKNVSLGNVLSSSYKGDKNVTFLSEPDQELLAKWKAPSFEVQVGLHELLGHGSGKMFHKSSDGTFNFEDTTVNPLTNEPIKSWYEPGETYSSKFSVMGSSYEECRAECVGLLLCLDSEILSVFGYSGTDADDVIYINWLNMARAGLLSLEFYSPDTKSWRQAHMQARYAILQVMLQADGLVEITEKEGADGKPDLLLTLDKSKIDTEGRKAISDFLLKIQVYKATADFEAANAWYQEGLSSMTDNDKVKFTKWRQVVLDRKVSRKMIVQCNTFHIGEDITLSEYEASAAGLVQSVRERFQSDSDSLDNIMTDLMEKDEKLWPSV